MKFETKFVSIYKIRPDGLFQEYIRHFIVTTNPRTGEVRTQFDKEIIGKIYKRATVGDIGVNGFTDYYNEQTGETIQLVAIQ